MGAAVGGRRLRSGTVGARPRAGGAARCAARAAAAPAAMGGGCARRRPRVVAPTRRACAVAEAAARRDARRRRGAGDCELSPPPRRVADAAVRRRPARRSAASVARRCFLAARHVPRSALRLARRAVDRVVAMVGLGKQPRASSHGGCRDGGCMVARQLALPRAPRLGMGGQRAAHDHTRAIPVLAHASHTRVAALAPMPPRDGRRPVPMRHRGMGARLIQFTLYCYVGTRRSTTCTKNKRIDAIFVCCMHSVTRFVEYAGRLSVYYAE